MLGLKFPNPPSHGQLGRVENENQSVFKNLLAFLAAIWYID